MEHRGTGGEWQTGYSYLSEMMEKGFIASCEEIGIPANPDLNTPDDTIGVTRFQTFIDSKGQRSSLPTAFLSGTVQQRPNLSVACNAHVSRVLYDHVSQTIRAQLVLSCRLSVEETGIKSMQGEKSLLAPEQ